jgi:DNA-binding NarL/FixJ family response regulator
MDTVIGVLRSDLSGDGIIDRPGPVQESNRPDVLARRNILLLDPCLMTRQCLERMLQVGIEEAAVVSAASLADAAGPAPSLVVLNIRGARVDEPEVADQLIEIRRRYHREPAIAVISDVDEPPHAIAAMRYGYRGYIPTSLSSELALAAIRLVLAGGIFVPDTVIAHCALVEGLTRDAPAITPETDALLAVTNRERQVLHLLRQGKPNKIIAFELEISESTVKVHVRNIMRKLRATNRTQVALLIQGQPMRDQVAQWGPLFA